MGTRSYADVPPTAATMALNAYIFGYGGHSLVTPHAALKHLWWTDQRILTKVTRPFVISKLRGEEREFLDKPMGFGDGLTDDTYMEWILERAKRLFLILTAIGVPEQIFGCIDDSWDDEDLPITLENVQNLDLAYENDQTLNRKFYDMQFVYLLRELRQGAHIDYGPKEHIPMDYDNTLPPAVSLQAWDRVHFPGRSDKIYMRRKYALVDKETDVDYRERFMADIKQAQVLRHEHIANVWASYTSEDAGYVLTDFVGEHTLGTFIDHRTPMQLLRVPLTDRPILLCEWMHCLADALASLHHRGAAHAAIRPSNILIDHDNHIAFADVGTLRTFQRGKKSTKSETYDYAAPESQLCKTPIVLATSPPISSMSAFSKLRKMSSSASSSSNSSTSSSTRSSSICTVTTSPITPPCNYRTGSMTTITATSSPTHLPRCSSSSFRNFSRHMQDRISPPPSTPTSPDMTITPVTILPRPTGPGTDTLHDLPEASPEMSDMYSLACVYLDIITFMLKGKLNEFVRFRSTRILSSMGTNKAKVRMDHSFHCDPEKIDAWMTILKHDSVQRRMAEQNSLTSQIYRGVPDLLKMIKSMMAQNAFLRPTAVEVRDRIREILVDQCGVETLCCAGREWDLPSSPADFAGHVGMYDSFSIATSSLHPPPSLGSRHCSRRGSASVDHGLGLLSRVGSSMSNATSDRRASTTSTMTAKMSPWRRVFSRSATR